MATLASVIIADVARRLNDTNNASRRWPDVDLLAFLNLGQKMVARGVPESSMANEFFELSEGFEQTLPDDAKGLYTVDYNAGITGLVKGRAILRIQFAQLDEIDPSWRGMTATTEVQHYYFESDNPTIFGVYPPNDGTQQVHIIYPIIPADCAAVNSPIRLRDEDVESLTQATIWHTLSDRSEYGDMRVLRNEAFEYLKINVNIQAGAEEPAK